MRWPGSQRGFAPPASSGSGPDRRAAAERARRAESRSPAAGTDGMRAPLPWPPLPSTVTSRHLPPEGYDDNHRDTASRLSRLVFTHEPQTCRKLPLKTRLIGMTSNGHVLARIWPMESREGPKYPEAQGIPRTKIKTSWFWPTFFWGGGDSPARYKLIKTNIRPGKPT